MYLQSIYDVVKNLYPGSNVVVDEKALTDEYICIQSIRGRAPDITLDHKAINKPCFKVTVSASTYNDMYLMSKAIYSALLMYTDTEILSVTPEMSLTPLGKDEKNYNLCYCTYKTLTR